MNANLMLPRQALGSVGVFWQRLCRWLLLLVVLLPVTATAAPFTVNGVVVDESGETLIGVYVVEKGTNNAVATDVSGGFTLKVGSPSSMLEFSYLGYKPQVVKAASNLRVVMQTQSTQLEDVVVVAYGTQKKVTVTGSVASAGNAELKKSVAPNITAALAGKLPGLTTIQSNGEPGNDDVTMYLRGVSTTNGAEPLILVDGVPRQSIREIDVNEVANISVLKDASATAVFGVRGANGVILVTTRRGEKGKVEVHPSVQYSMQSFSRKRTRVNSWDYVTLLNEARANEGLTAAFSPEETALFESWRNGGPENPDDRYWYPNTNWHDILFKDYASMVRANVDISGGSDKLQYFVNAGYLYQGGMYNTESKSKLGYDPQSTLNRYNFRSNIDYKFSNYVKASVDVSSFIEKVNGTNGNKEVIYATGLTNSPTTPGPTTPEGTDYMVQNGGVFRPVRPGQVINDPTQGTEPAYGHLNRKGYRLETRSGLNVIGNLNVDLSFLTKGLSMKGLVSFESRAFDTRTANRDFVIYKFSRTATPGVDGPYFLYDGDDDEDTPISLSRGISSGWLLNMQLQANYERTFGKKHYVTGMVLAQRDLKEARENEGYADPYLPFNVIGIAGRATYAFDSRYLAEFNIGYNGSEQFAPGHRFGVFPAFSGGWVVSNESFLRDNKVLTNLKLRASYGKVGNDRFGGRRFLYLDNIKRAGGSFWNVSIPSIANGGKISEAYVGNPDITWETAWKQNYGIDISLFRDLSASFDYFIEHRDGILIQRGTVRVMNGLPIGALPLVNMGKVDNEGYEITLNYHRQIGKDWSVRAGGNFAYNKNTVKEYDEVLLSDDYAYRYRTEGFSIGQQWGYLIDHSTDLEHGRDGSGYFFSQESIDKSGLKYNIGTPRPGDFIYRDLNGDGIIDTKDLAPIGYSSIAPRITYGFNFGFSWKGLDVSAMFQGVGQYSRYYSGWGIFEEIGSKSYIDMNFGRWSQERYEAGEKITAPRLANSTSTSHTQNDYYIMDASYLRLKNVEIGYTLPKNITEKFGASNLRVYATGENLYTWDSLRTDCLDPEQTSVLTYPLLRTFSFGLSVNF